MTSVSSVLNLSGFSVSSGSWWFSDNARLMCWSQTVPLGPIFDNYFALIALMYSLSFTWTEMQGEEKKSINNYLNISAWPSCAVLTYCNYHLVTRLSQCLKKLRRYPTYSVNHWGWKTFLVKIWKKSRLKETKYLLNGLTDWYFIFDIKKKLQANHIWDREIVSGF